MCACRLPHDWPWLMSIIYQCHFSHTVLHQLWQSLLSRSVLSSFSLYLVFYYPPLSPVLLLSLIFPQLQVSLSFLIFHHLPLCVPARQAGVCTDTYTAALSYLKSIWERTEKIVDSAVCVFTRRGASFSGDLFRLCAKRCHHQGNGSLFAAMHVCKKINK